MKLLAALLFASSAATAAAAPALPTEITAEYQLVSSGLTIGRVKETFVRKGDTYSIQSVTRSEGLLKIFLDDQLTLQSTGRVVPTGLQPLTFSQRRAKDASRDIEATFDWEHGVMRSLYKGERSEVPLPPDTQDRISVMYQFMNITPRAEVTIPMANGRKVELYTYRFVDEARVSTPAGEFDTLHYQRVTSSPKESRAEVWLAKDRFNFPVRLVFDDPKGLRIEQALVALQSR